jgi:hypothetical protein
MNPSIAVLPNIPFLFVDTGMPSSMPLLTSESRTPKGSGMRDFFGDGKTATESSSSLRFARLRFDLRIDGDPSREMAAARLRTWGERVDAADELVGTGEKINFD